MSGELANLLHCIRRLLDAPADQSFLALDRLNDVDVAMWEYERSMQSTGLAGLPGPIGASQFQLPWANRPAVTARGLRPTYPLRARAEPSPALSFPPVGMGLGVDGSAGSPRGGSGQSGG